MQFDPVALHDSIDKIMSHNPQRLYLTHYSELTPSAKIIAGLHEQIDDYVMMAEQAANAGDTMESVLKKELTDYTVRRCMNELPDCDEETAQQWVKMDAELNAQGLAFWWQHRRN